MKPMPRGGGEPRPIMELRFTVASPKSMSEVTALLSEGGRFMKTCGEPQVWPDPFPSEWVLTHIDARCVYLASAGAHGTVATFMVVDRDPPFWGERSHPSLHIHRMAVRREMAGRGIGKQIVDWVASGARERGIGVLRLECLRGARRLRAYYESLGFELVGEANLDGLELSLYERHLKWPKTEPVTRTDLGRRLV